MYHIVQVTIMIISTHIIRIIMIIFQPSANANSEDRIRNKYYRDPKHRTRMITLHVRGMHTTVSDPYSAATSPTLMTGHGLLYFVNLINYT